jgi:signal transduction histidine kinase/CheY-like chemotaxis protein/HPt (histidine-containing phosphotransfer) domain-containing protein
LKKKLRKLSLKPSIVKLSSSYLLLVSISLFLLCLALGSALMTSFHAKELITKRQNLTETNNIVYSLLIDLGHEDIFFHSEDNKFNETKNLSIYQISKILNSYSKEINIDELSSFNELAKQFVETPLKERRKITYKLQIEAKKILSALRDQISILTEEVETEMTKIISTMTLIISCAAIFMFFSVLYNFVDRKKWNELINETTAAKKAAENLSNLKTQFLATVSHEVRTPLNGIIATAEVLGQNKSMNSEAQSLCNVIQRSGNTLLRIINDILDYSKIESGNIQFEFDNFNLRDLIEEIILTNKHRALQKNIDLKVIYKTIKYENIFMDRDRLAQVLYNVIGNAIKFTNEGSVTLFVDTYEDKKNKYLQLTVKDTGIGISEDERDKVFVPFIQIQTQGTSGEPGTGLGLSISKRIVDKLNGELSFESSKGIGTEFTIKIPVKKGGKEKVNSLSNDSNLTIWNSPVHSTQNLNKTEKIVFIAEDNPTNQIVINTMLNFENIRHVLFSNGVELLVALERTMPRLILMDCQMPIMDGYTATKMIKDKYPELFVIAMTADATDQNISNCKLNGFDGIMIKPLNMNKINDLLLDFRLIDEVKTEPVAINPAEGDSISIALESLDKMFGKDKRIKITNAFLKQINELDQELIEKKESLNLEGLKRIGHKFKSSSQVIGAHDFFVLFQSLEASNEFENSIELINKILVEKQKVISAIEKSS